MSQHFCLTQEGSELREEEEEERGGGKKRLTLRFFFSTAKSVSLIAKGKWLTLGHFHKWLTEVMTEFLTRVLYVPSVVSLGLSLYYSFYFASDVVV